MTERRECEQMEALTRTLLYTAKVVRLRMENALAERGGAFSTFVVLDALAEQEGVSQRDLADRVYIEGPTLTRHLDHLEADGLVERRRDPGDRRVIRVYLTSAGHALYDRLYPCATGMEAQLREGMSAEEAAQFAALLNATRERFGQASE